MSNPFFDAQDQASYDPSEGEVPEPLPPFESGTFAPGAPSPGGRSAAQAPEPPKFHDGSIGAIGQMRDTLMQQFPEVNNIGEEPLNLSTPEKLGLLAVAIRNPRGALDIVRDRRSKQLAKRRMAAELNLKMLGVAGEVVKSQNDVERLMFQSRLDVANFQRQQEQDSFNEELRRGAMNLQGVQTELAREELTNRRRMGDLVGGFGAAESTGGVEYDDGGNPISVPRTLGDVALPGGGRFAPRRSLSFNPRTGDTRVSVPAPSEENARLQAIRQSIAPAEAASIDHDAELTLGDPAFLNAPYQQRLAAITRHPGFTGRSPAGRAYLLGLLGLSRAPAAAGGLGALGLGADDLGE